jgi:predicted secreted Zn-dependent protease
VLITEMLASHFADRVDTVLLAVSAADPARALDGWKATNRLRTELVEGSLDVPLTPSIAAKFSLPGNGSESPIPDRSP